MLRIVDDSANGGQLRRRRQWQIHGRYEKQAASVEIRHFFLRRWCNQIVWI
jgi:hypothetical protein